MSVLDELKKQMQDSKETGSFKSTSKQVGLSGDLITGFSVPVELQRDGGKLRCYVHLSPSAIETTDTLDAVLSYLSELFDLAIWRSRESGSSGFKSYKKRY